MKSEHRHELKTNDLAQQILTFPDYIKLYGGRVALGVVIVILIIILILQRINKGNAEAIKRQDDLAYSLTQIDKLTHLNAKPGDMGQIRKILQEIRDDGSDKRISAEATLALGDLAWTLANFPELPGATTEPSLRPERDRSELIKDAKDNYQQVIDKFADQNLAVVAAHFGLAAVAENGSNWDESRRQLNAVKGLGDWADQFKRLADLKLKRLDDIREPLLVGLVPDKAEPLPTPDDTFTFPSTAPTTGPTTAPAATTKPAAPTTKPTK